MCSGTLNLPKGEYACRLSPTRGLSATRTKGFLARLMPLPPSISRAMARRHHQMIFKARHHAVQVARVLSPCPADAAPTEPAAAAAAPADATAWDDDELSRLQVRCRSWRSQTCSRVTYWL